MITYREISSAFLEEVKEIYSQAGWTAYLNDSEKLKRAFDRSLFLLGAFDGPVLVGFVRCVGDGEHVLLVQGGTAVRASATPCSAPSGINGAACGCSR